jgi:hypothetical protein
VNLHVIHALNPLLSLEDVMKSLSSVCLVLLGVGVFATDCNYFSNVVIPAQDTAPPVPASSLIVNAGPQQVSLSPIYLTTHDPSDSFIAIAAIWDGGGAKRVTMTSKVLIRCQNASAGLGQITEFWFIPTSATQSGVPGDTVQDGVWTYGTFQASKYTGFCKPGFTLQKIDYSWEMEGEDFHGNHAQMSGGTLTYQPLPVL